MNTNPATQHVLLAIVIGGVLALPSCKKQSAVIQIDGSSTVFPIAEAVAEEFQKGPGKNTRVTVGVSGTGGGFQKFCRGESDISTASRPIKPTEIESCKKHNISYIEVPVAYDGIAIVVNAKNTWAHDISVEELKRLWQPEAQGHVTRWNQVRADWPDKEVHLFGAGVDSGTYDYFTEAIVGKAQSSRGDFTSSEDDNVLVQGVATDALALGFFGVAYYEENKERLKLLPVDDHQPGNGAGPIPPSMETVRNGTYQPLSRPLFVYVRATSLDRPEVASFVHYLLEKSPQLAMEVGTIPLPENAYALARARVDKRETGSVFGAHTSQVGISIDALFAPSAKEAPK